MCCMCEEQHLHVANAPCLQSQCLIKLLYDMQENGLVPIVEPEITLGPGTYTIEVCENTIIPSHFRYRCQV